PLASTQCPPPLSANPSTGLHSASSTPLCPIPPLASTQCPPPPLPIPPLASTQCPPPPSANPSTGLHPPLPPPSANPSTGFRLPPWIKFKILTLTYKAVHHTAPNYITDLISKYHPTRTLRSSHKTSFSLVPWSPPPMPASRTSPGCHPSSGTPCPNPSDYHLLSSPLGAP
ncbi:unnamed protein product, partial [Staurois parvus]